MQYPLNEEQKILLFDIFGADKAKIYIRGVFDDAEKTKLMFYLGKEMGEEMFLKSNSTGDEEQLHHRRAVRILELAKIFGYTGFLTAYTEVENNAG